jgi:hypothetical protein
MIARGEVLVRTGHVHEAYDTAGSLKWVHGVTLHAILVLPAIAVLLAARNWPVQRRTRAVTIAIAVYSAATVAALVVSLAAG